MKKSLLAVCILVGSSSAIAADAGTGTITFMGDVNSGACVISPTDVKKEVSLGSVNTATLAKLGDEGPTENFQLKLLNCKLDDGKGGSLYTKVNIQFNGTADSVTSTLWRNTGTAKFVAVAFNQADGKEIKPGDKFEQELSTTETTIYLSAKMKSTGVATAGTVRSVANYVLTYN